MKKSWHPLLLKNQEQVWLKEKAAVRSLITSSLCPTATRYLHNDNRI
jgi:hypothetical protein